MCCQVCRLTRSWALCLVPNHWWRGPELGSRRTNPWTHNPLHLSLPTPTLWPKPPLSLIFRMTWSLKHFHQQSSLRTPTIPITKPHHCQSTSNNNLGADEARSPRDNGVTTPTNDQRITQAKIGNFWSRLQSLKDEHGVGWSESKRSGITAWIFNARRRHPS